jgi:hypothetical protein
MFSLPEKFPDVFGRKGDQGGEFELQEMVLTRVEIHAVDSGGVGGDGVGERVVSCGGDYEHNIFVRDIQDLLVFAGILLLISIVGTERTQVNA